MTRNIVVFGANSSIAKSLIKKLGSNQTLHLFYRDREKVKVVKEICAKKNIVAKFYKLDLADTGKVISYYQNFLLKNPKIDYFVYLSGVRGTKNNEITYNIWKNTFSINLESAFFTALLTAKKMQENKVKGKIVFISSTTAYYGGAPDYSASKAGILSITKSLAKDFAVSGININSIAPGYIETEIHNWSHHKLKSKLANVPLGRLCTTNEIADLILFLLSNKSEYITGSSIDINGGLNFR